VQKWILKVQLLLLVEYGGMYIRIDKEESDDGKFNKAE
jgi:hypothetical protein